MRILFWGTPEFATPALLALIGEDHEVVGVVTQPDRPKGRSRSTLVPSPVKVIALEEGIPIFQPERARDPEFIAQIRALAPDISVVVAYGQLLSQEIIDIPRLGTVNIHASLLPRWRGAAPIQAALLAGDAETGVSIQQMVLALDAGDVLFWTATPIPPDETAGELTERLAELGAVAIIECLALMDLGDVRRKPQDPALVTVAPKISRTVARLNFKQDALQVAREIRAYDPRPGAWALLRDDEVRLFGARVLPDRRGEPGEVLEIGEMGMVVACGSGAVAIENVHAAGKRRLAALDFAQGRGVAVGDYLS
jgi:methionyl-tRNA formyltransferase